MLYSNSSRKEILEKLLLFLSRIFFLQGSLRKCSETEFRCGWRLCFVLPSLSCIQTHTAAAHFHCAIFHTHCFTESRFDPFQIIRYVSWQTYVWNNKILKKWLETMFMLFIIEQTQSLQTECLYSDIKKNTTAPVNTHNILFISCVFLCLSEAICCRKVLKVSWSCMKKNLFTPPTRPAGGAAACRKLISQREDDGSQPENKINLEPVWIQNLTNAAGFSFSIKCHCLESAVMSVNCKANAS